MLRYVVPTLESTVPRPSVSAAKSNRGLSNETSHYDLRNFDYLSYGYDVILQAHSESDSRKCASQREILLIRGDRAKVIAI